VVFEGDERYIGRLVDIRISRSTGFTLFGQVAAGD
jgi:TRAM domain